MLCIVLASCILSWITPALAEREHKVHNIVLYPERHSWCQTTPIKQVVALPGYEAKTIDNNVCVGACYSYSIPRTQPAEPGELIGPYCDSCQPVDTRCYHVNLKADEQNEDGPRTVQKRVQIITNCTCLSCNKIQNTDCELTDESTAELPPDLFAILYGNATLLSFNSSHDDVRELLNLPKDRADNGSNATSLMMEEQRDQLKSKLLQMLKSVIENEDAEQENGILEQLVEILENPRGDVSSKNVIALFNYVSGEEIDVVKIKEVMLNIKKDQDLMEKHRNFGLGNYVVDVDTAKKNAEINRDIENMGKTYNVKNFGIEGSHAGLGVYKGSHIGMGIQDHRTDSNTIPENIHKSHPHHFVGEVETVGLDTGRLMKGPHDSLVLVPTSKIEKKLHLEPDNIKPNEEGVVIEYENHPRDSHMLHL